ncbi:MAG: Gfo/Idh/MocA family oxidoreductase [bacterium]|nr:Gfo/Idh/MocA family oxidoreductase [bacterium]
MGYDLNRRQFLAMSAALGASNMLPGCMRMGRRRIAPLSRLNHACIGVGGIGEVDLKNILEHAKTQVVAICDVDATRLAKAAEKLPDARRYMDWRQMLEKEGDRIDSVNVSVPDHMHAMIARAALRAGKNVYCQKPLCHDVAECRALAETARKAGLVTQLGTQLAAGIGDRTAVHYLRAHAIGTVRKVILSANRPGVEHLRLTGPRPAQGTEPPATLAWDLWLGTAPERPFAPDIYHPMTWRSWQDFGTGWSGDIGCHIFDSVWKGLGLTAPISVVAEVQESWRNSPARRADTWPQSNHITWVFPGNEKSGGKEFTIEWFDGEFYPPEEAQAIARQGGFQRFPTEGSLVIGTDGALLLPSGSGAMLLPKDKFRDYPRPVLQPRNHYHHFLDACMGGEMTESHFVQTGPMAEAIILGTVAVRRPGEELHWNSARLKVTNSRAAQKLLKRSYRTGW